jgi:hypothetical protein
MTATKSSYIKDVSFYADAEDMQEGWGETLRNIDVLKDKIQYNQDVTLDEFCYSLYGDGYCSHCTKAFKLYIKREMNYDDRQLVYTGWNGIFKNWVNTEYDISKHYEI